MLTSAFTSSFYFTKANRGYLILFLTLLKIHNLPRSHMKVRYNNPLFISRLSSPVAHPKATPEDSSTSLQ